MIYRYSYTTESSFSPEVTWHFFKLRAIPCTNEFQKVTDDCLEIRPSCLVSRATDGLGNAVQWGTISQGHSSFTVTSEGTVNQLLPYAIHESPEPYYIAPTRLTAWNDEMSAAALNKKKDGSVFDSARNIMRMVNKHMTYTPCLTTTETSAIEVYEDPRGVCQDYAHLMIALCRAAGIYARYVNGIIAGTGQTHAWVEVSDGNVWLAFDPTHNTMPEWGYVKIAHGRDANDCPTNRGRFYSWTTERQTVMCQLSPNIIY
ncbi:MAG: transglutaminase family protein [Bacteroidales bacterium]|nr:transglutaminase family protein [Candidatus Liminaster caballi]